MNEVPTEIRLYLFIARLFSRKGRKPCAFPIPVEHMGERVVGVDVWDNDVFAVAPSDAFVTLAMECNGKIHNSLDGHCVIFPSDTDAVTFKLRLDEI